MKSFITILLLATAIYSAYSLCNVCSYATDLACIDRDTFKFCVGGLPTPPGIKCPNGTVCTSGAMICAPENSSTPACDECNKCNENKTFACTGYNSFSLCYGGDDPDPNLNYICADNLVCNSESDKICVDETSGIGSTCSWTTAVTPAPEATTTPSPLDNPKGFCESKKTRGRFEVPSDETCTFYINCYQDKGVWYGDTYYCPASTYFNATTQLCGRDIPERCAATDLVCD